MIHFLVESGANTAISDGSGKNALEIAINAGRHDIVGYFTSRTEICALVQKIAYNTATKQHELILMKLIDSHCHLDRLDLKPYNNDFKQFVETARNQNLAHMLCVGIDLKAYPAMRKLVDGYDDISVSVGVHPNTKVQKEPTVEELMTLADDKKVIAIGETGLDYYRSKGDLRWQKDRFRTHIEIAKKTNKPIIIHTREAGQDALDILSDMKADEVGGIIHCFSEDWAFAKRALDLNFYISFSGIVTYKTAENVQEAALKVPKDRFLIETDCPYLAPVPHRGKPNYPMYVKHVAEFIAKLRKVSVNLIAEQSTQNFNTLFDRV